ncbi:MAG TPA: SPFH domain-containing protein [Polyangia bacterium]|nr:SPFH domain-containing protein [Polyangia bacterium]
MDLNVNLIFALGAIGIVFLIVLSLIVTRLLYICSPNEVLIFSGGQRASAGKKVGYRVIKGGRAIRIPMLEAVDRMDLTNMPIEVSVTGAYSKGGIPLNVHGIANLKIAGEPPVLDNAVERFLGVGRNEIMAVAKEALEGNLRGVLATLTPEEVNQDKIKFAQSLLSEAEDDLRRIGIELDTLKIQDVSDEVGYLDSIGRKQSAEVQKTALIAEARSKAESAVQAARNHRDTELSRLDAMAGTLKADNARRLTDAQTRTAALVAEAKGEVASKQARAEADVDVQKARVEQVRRQLQADLLEPARARKAAAEASAKGAASKIIEQGRATAAAMQDIAVAWHDVGDNARNVFLLQKVDGLMKQVMQTVSGLKVEKLTVLGGIGGAGGGGGDMTGKVIAASEQLKAATGVDLLGAVRDRMAGGAVTPER